MTDQWGAESTSRRWSAGTRGRNGAEPRSQASIFLGSRGVSLKGCEPAILVGQGGAVAPGLGQAADIVDGGRLAHDPPVGDLAGGDIGRVALRVVVGQPGGDRRAEAQAQKHDLPLAQLMAKRVGERERVAHQGIDVEIRVELVARFGEGLAGAAHIPLHDSEIGLPALEGAEVGAGHGAGTIGSQAAHHQDHRVGAVTAADRHPLVDAVDGDELFLIDPLGIGDRERRRSAIRRRSELPESRDWKQRNQGRHAARPTQRPPRQHHPPHKLAGTLHV